MSGVHKHPTISFRVSDREREMIEAKILASGMQKKDYFEDMIDKFAKLVYSRNK